MKPFSRKNIFKFSALSAFISLGLLLFLVYNHFQFKKEITAPAQQNIREKTIQLAGKIDTLLEQSIPIANALSEDLSNIPFNASDLAERLKRVLNINPDLIGVGLAYAPFTYDPDVRLFAPYFTRQAGELKRVQIENFLDYTIESYHWYHDPLKEGARWNEPRFSQTAGQKVIEYALPFFQKDPKTGQQQKRGIVFLHYALSSIFNEIKALRTGKTGYGMMLSKKGEILFHPNKEYVDAGQNILTLTQKTGNILLKNIVQHAISGENITLQGESVLTGTETWANLQHIPTTGWTLAMLYNKEELTKGNQSLRRRLIWIAVLFILFALSLILMDLSRRETRSIPLLWLSALKVSILFMFGIALTWFLATDNVGWKNTERTVILNQNDLNAFKMENIRSALGSRQPLPIYIPTGVFVQSIEFTSANNVILTGYVWQYYNKNIPDDLSRGFVLPEAESSKIDRVYRRKEKNGEVIGWYFHVTLRQDFNYTQYPFDQQTVWMRFWHKDFDKNIVLTPALDSYDLIHPERLPGIEEDFVLPGWEVYSSFFNYRFNSYNTDFGIPRYVGQNKFPELYFQIGVKRRFLNPFISNLTPIIVVLLMLFAVLITSSKNSNKIQVLGFNASTTLASSSALFFVVLISHIDLRGSLAANEIFYMEYFYVVTYATILSISINAILFSWDIKIPFIQYRDNLLPKLFYWP
ncbi:MAG: cache domain-containing protein, partial [Nitrospirota bacterium]|nr:cache domain-containing protein [Nitrospirota bacterium]